MTSISSATPRDVIDTCCLGLYPIDQIDLMLRAGKAMLSCPLKDGQDEVPLDLPRRFRTPSEFLYHSHRPNELGHFHLTQSNKQKAIHGNPHSKTHICALSIDPEGNPVSVFTTNYWVTKDKWVEDIGPVVAAFDLSAKESSANDWLNHAVCFFRPQIIVANVVKNAFAREKLNTQGRLFYEDRNFEILSSIQTSTPLQMQALELSLKDRDRTPLD